MSTKSSFRSGAPSLLLAALLALGTTAGAAGYHLLKKISVPGDYGWDYAATDSDGRRLYVGHDQEVTVINIDTDTVVGRLRAVLTCTGPQSHVSLDADSSAKATRDQ